MAFECAIVLTGSIATGKSTVAAYFKRSGFVVIDADKIAHMILDKEHQHIETLFGKGLSQNQKVDRKALGSIVFNDKVKRQKLENFLHPLIFDEIKRLSSKEDILKKPYFVDIPLFFEKKRYPIARSLVVYTPKVLQLKRLMQREEYTEEEALLRINSQIDIEEKRNLASYLIDNSFDLSYLDDACKKVKNKIIKDFNDCH